MVKSRERRNACGEIGIVGLHVPGVDGVAILRIPVILNTVKTTESFLSVRVYLDPMSRVSKVLELRV